MVGAGMRWIPPWSRSYSWVGCRGPAPRLIRLVTTGAPSAPTTTPEGHHWVGRRPEKVSTGGLWARLTS